ncbi:uncharacterized protein LOC132270788 [Cornus florida]|uniref:uncharacterized protein LOC132270788 n=1 Tax=Cornus florida TaxID=4283 RepID=UPI00289A4D67|nr:uncharacterized protein LOC132270788 [Cornus florida]
MTTLGLSSAAESSMDDDGGCSTARRHNHRLQTLSRTKSFNTTVTTTTAKDGHFPGGFCTNGVDEEEEAENFDEGGAEVWGTFAESFRQVQSILDRNRVLIQQVNENHQSKVHGNMVKNVALIQEINGNISKVVSLYSDLSTNFSGLFRQRNPSVDPKNSDAKDDDDSQPPINRIQ